MDQLSSTSDGGAQPRADPPAVPADTSEDTLAGARRLRHELQATLVELERVLAAPAPGRVGAWAAPVLLVLDRLRADLDRHIEVTEGDGGLYRDVLSTAPRLAKAVARLEHEHGSLRTALDEAVRGLTAMPPDQPEDEAETWVCGARDRLTSLIGLFSRHRQRGADLVYEAYSSDIGGTG
ncbi:MAG: hemerythrin domain-containing protein [Actinomycetes bacterium]